MFLIRVHVRVPVVRHARGILASVEGREKEKKKISSVTPPLVMPCKLSVMPIQICFQWFWCSSVGWCSNFLVREELAPLIVIQRVDVLLRKLKGREEDGVDDAGASHGHAEAAIHVLPEERDLWGRLDLLASRV